MFLQLQLLEAKHFYHILKWIQIHIYHDGNELFQLYF